jgi:hypothetical protein
MATIAAILDALALQISDQLADVTDIAIDVQPRAFQAQTVPCVDMFVTGINALDQNIASYQDVYGGWPVALRIRVNPGDLYAGEDLLLALMDDEDDLSVILALDYDRTIGGLADTMNWGVWTGYQEFPNTLGGGEGLIGSTLPIVIVKAKS